MILDPVNDQQCLGLLVERARELVRTRMAYDAAARLRNVRNVIAYLQALPQTDDDGRERVQLIACDVPQRLRFLPPDPNCFERTLAALVLLELIDPKTERVPVSIDEPERHTGIVEREAGGQWQVVDLFPRRNTGRLESGESMCPVCHRYKPLDERGRIVRHEYPSGGMCTGGGRPPLWPHGRPRRARNNTVQDVFGIVHPIGHGVLSVFGLGGVADRLGRLEQKEGWLAKDEPAPTANDVPSLARPAGRAQHGRPVERAPYSTRPAERDPELAGRAVVDPKQLHSESGGPEHGYEEDAESATPSSSTSSPTSRGAGDRGGATRSEAAKRFFW